MSSLKFLPILFFTIGMFGRMAVAAEASRPNVLFIIVDDLTTTLGSYGDRDAQTPQMDRLASEGMRFDRAYTQFSLCNPSRASFLTGCYPERTKVYDLSVNFRKALPDVVTLPELFKDAGYAVGRIGKVFHKGGTKEKLDVELGAPLSKDSAILDEAKLAEASEGDLSDPPREKKKKAGKKGGEDGESSKDYNCNFAASSHPGMDFTDYEIASRAIETMETFQSEKKPFFLTVGFIRPHTPYVAPKAFFDRIDPEKIAMPAFYQTDGEDRSDIPDAALRPNNNVFRYTAPTNTQARAGRRAYLASAAWVDSQVGRVLNKLKELNLDQNTIVLLTGDHGYQLGEHGLWAKQTLFEEGTHVPLIVAGPGVKPGVSEGLVEQVDIYPTLAGMAGLSVPDSVQGMNLQPLLADPSAKGKPVAFSTMLSTHTKLMGHALTDGRYRYIEWDGGKAGRQLYDHETDPHELKNLADEPAQAALVAQFHDQLEKHLQSVGGGA